MSLGSWVRLIDRDVWLEAWEKADMEHKIWGFDAKFSDIMLVKGPLGRLDEYGLVCDWGRAWKALDHKVSRRWGERLIEIVSGMPIDWWAELAGQFEFDDLIESQGPVLL